MKLIILVLTICFLALGEETDSLIDLERQYRHVIAKLEPAGPSAELSSTLNGLAALYFEQRQFKRAEDISRRSLAVEQALSSPRPLEIARRLNNIAAACTAQGKIEEAARLMRELLAIYERMDAGADHAIALNNLGILELKARKYEEAAAHFARALPLLANQPADFAKTTANLAETQSVLGRTDEAIATWSRALAVAEAKGLDSERDYGAMLCLYAKTLARAGRKSRSDDVRRRGKALLDQARAPSAYTIDRSDFR